MKYFYYFSQQAGFDFSCKLSPLETVCMKSQILFLGKIRKLSSVCRLLRWLHTVFLLPYFTRETTFGILCLVFLHMKPLLKKMFTLKGKKLLPIGANSFLLK